MPKSKKPTKKPSKKQSEKQNSRRENDSDDEMWLDPFNVDNEADIKDPKIEKDDTEEHAYFRRGGFGEANDSDAE